MKRTACEADGERSTSKSDDSGNLQRRARESDIADITSRDFLERFRAEVDLLADELAECPAEQVIPVLQQGIDQPGIGVVLAGAGMREEALAEDLARNAGKFVPTAVSSAQDFPRLVKVRLLASLDTAWWRSARAFRTDDEITRSSELVDLRWARSQKSIEFAFRTQAFDPLRRAVRAADRRLWPRRTPRTIGMRLPYARWEMIGVLNSIAAEFSRWAPSSSGLWVNSLVRSIEYQEAMRGSGYTVADGSAHCVGWAADIEMAWMVRNGYGDILADILRSRAEAGQLNVIDEGQAWHICLNPAVVQSDSEWSPCVE